MKPAAALQIYRDYDGAWVWICWGCDDDRAHAAATHAEALAAALDHCAKAGQS